MTAKHYGIVDEIAQHEPDGVTGNLSISSVLADSVHAPASLVVVGSTTSSSADLAQLVLTAEQAIALGAKLSVAGAQALEADRDIENLRRYGASAARLCFALAEADAVDVLVDQARVRLGYPLEAQLLAEQAYDDVDYSGDWREAWREAGERLRKEVGNG